MLNIYVYVLDTLADWELGNVVSELNRPLFQKRAPQVTLKTVSCSKDPIRTMGGITVVPDLLIDDIIVSESSVLILPGANTWNEPQHHAVLQKASELLSAGGLVCAVCGATAALANVGMLDDRRHTSNGPGFLEMMSPVYKGQDFYIDEPSVTDKNLITAACTGALLWAKQIIEYLGVFSTDTLEYWYKYFSTGSTEAFSG